MSVPLTDSLDEWLQWLEVLHPVSIDLELSRIRQVAKQAGLLQPACPVITIGGTTGKGSCVAVLEAIYLAAGYRVGSYTSPHILRFNERIRLNGQEASDADIVQALRFIEQKRDGVSLSYFEYTTLAALYLFSKQAVSVILLEVGLGGQFDAVNIIDAQVSLVASVDIDHTDYLGDTREQIGFEKAGIYRQNRPAICGDIQPPQSLVQYVQKIGARGLYQGQDFGVFNVKEDISFDWQGAGCIFKSLPWPKLMLSNVATALMACVSLVSELPVDEKAVQSGVGSAKVAGRFEQLAAEPCVIVDVGHNPAAARALAQRLTHTFQGKTIRAVFSALQDKDLAGIVAPLKSVIAQWYVAPVPCARSRTKEELLTNMQLAGIEKMQVFDDIQSAFSMARLHSAKEECIIVFGSFYTVAQVSLLLEHSHG